MEIADTEKVLDKLCKVLKCKPSELIQRTQGLLNAYAYEKDLLESMYGYPE